MTDQSANVVWAADYLPFGKADVTVSTVENNLRFAGQYLDAETGLHYNYHRYYDPKLGRYLRPDPSHSLFPNASEVPYLIPLMIFNPQELNPYSFVQNNPINRYDLRGLHSNNDDCIAGCLYRYEQKLEELKWLFKNRNCHGIKKCDIYGLLYDLLMLKFAKEEFDRCVKSCICD